MIHSNIYALQTWMIINSAHNHRDSTTHPVTCMLRVKTHLMHSIYRSKYNTRGRQACLPSSNIIHSEQTHFLSRMNMTLSTFFTSILAFFLCTPAFAETPSEVSKKDFSYSFGILIGKSMREQGIDNNDIDKDVFLKALQATLKEKKTKWNEQQAQIYVMKKIQEIQAKQAEKVEKEHKKFFDKNAKEGGVVSLPSGVQYTILKAGNGEKVKADDTVRVHYTGSLVDGSVFDSSVARDKPATLGVYQVISGWQEILPKMNVGSKWKIFIPPSLGYGAKQAGIIPPHSILIFEIEVLSIEQ